MTGSIPNHPLASTEVNTRTESENTNASTVACGSFWPALAVSVLGGLMFSVPFRWPELAWVQWVSVLPLFWALRGQSADRAFWLGWFYGVAATMFGYDHLVGTMVRFARFNILIGQWFPSLVAYPAVIAFLVAFSGWLILTLFGALTAFSFALFAWLTRRIAPRFNPPLAAAIWTGIEMIYPNLFPRTIAHTQYLFLPFIQAADLGGVPLLNFVMVWVQAAVFLPLADRGPRRIHPLAHLGLAACVLGLILLYGHWRIEQVQALDRQSPVMKIGTVQPNIAPLQIMDMSPANQARLLKRQQRLSDQLRDCDLVVWPESARLLWYNDNMEDLNQPNLIELGYFPYPQLGKPLLFGALGFTPDPKDPVKQLKLFNRNILISSKGRILGWFDKHILMPFGETLPLASVIPYRKLLPTAVQLTPGESLAPLRMENGTLLGVMSCYEDMMSWVPREMVREGAQALVVLLNDNWFGDTAAPYQHMMLSLFRTVECRRYLVRGTNTGVSVIAAPWGEIVAQAPPFTEAVNRGTVHLGSEQTFYVRYGDIFGWACVGVMGIGLLLSFFRPRRINSTEFI